jgi:hypothetical protein
MYQLMLYPDVALAQFTEGYLNDCTDSFSKEHFFGEGAFGTLYLGQDKEDVRLKYMIQKAPIQLASKSDLASFHDIFQRDLAVRFSMEEMIYMLIGFSVHIFLLFQS